MRVQFSCRSSQVDIPAPASACSTCGDKSPPQLQQPIDFSRSVAVILDQIDQDQRLGRAMKERDLRNPAIAAHHGLIKLTSPDRRRNVSQQKVKTHTGTFAFEAWANEGLSLGKCRLRRSDMHVMKCAGGYDISHFAYFAEHRTHEIVDLAGRMQHEFAVCEANDCHSGVKLHA